jgi:pimeloyl-ACP methyl ester carboxylesterase
LTVTTIGKTEHGIPFIRVGDEVALVVVNGGQGFVRQPSPSRLIRDAKRVARILPAGRSFALLGYDPEPAPHLSIEDVVGRVVAAIREVAPERKVDLVGISYGGMIACHVATSHRHLVRRLVLVASGHRFSTRGADHVRRQVALLEADDRVGFASTFSGLFRKRLLNWLMAATVRFGRRRVAEGMAPTPVILRYLRAMLSAPPARLAEVAAPALVIGGSADQFFGEGVMEEAALAFASGALHIVPGETHMAPVEDPRSFRKRIETFLSTD